MDDRFVTLTAGRYEGWAVQVGDHATWQSGTVSRWLTAHHPRLPGLENLRINLTLSIARGDPQWDLLTAARYPGGRAVNAVALETVLARISTALAVRDPATDWHVRAGRTATADLAAAAHGVAGPGTTVTLTASARHPGNQHDFGTAYRVWDRLCTAGRGSAEREDAFGWLLDTIPALPEMPASGTDWAAQTRSFLSQPFPGAPRVGQIEVVFTNAINGNSERHPVRDIDEARRLAGEHQPYNNTRVAAYRVVSVNLGIPSRQELDLAPAHRPAAGHPAALARSFDSPGGTPTTPATGSGGRPGRAHPSTQPPTRAPGSFRR